MWPFKSKPVPKPESPPTTPEFLAEAKRNPDGWVYILDGKFGPEDAVPPERIVGAWKVGPTGEATGEYKANHNYRPAKP